MLRTWQPSGLRCKIWRQSSTAASNAPLRRLDGRFRKKNAVSFLLSGAWGTLVIENSASDPKRILAVAVPAHILKVTLPEVGGAFSGCCAACLT